MSRKAKLIIEKTIVPAILTTALIIVCFWGISRSALAQEYKNVTEAMYRHSFTELCDDFSNMEVSLGKLMAVNSSTQYVMLLDDIWRLSGSTVSLMSQIPSSHIDTSGLNSFVVRVGDYSHALTKKALRGAELSEDDMKQMKELHDKCAEISKDLDQRLASGDIPLAVITNDEFFSSAQNIDEYSNPEGLNEFPTLIYDGPFSESTEKLEAKGLSGNEVSEDTARSIAQSLAREGAALNSSNTSDGVIPSYDFSFTAADGRDIDVSITKRGGMVLWMMSSSTTDNSQAPDEQESERLTEAARKKLKDMGFEAMQPTYAQYYSGTFLINFAATQNDIILYNDLVKVWVDRNSAEVIGIDARNYFFSHVERELEEPVLTLDDAEAKVSPNLEVVGRELALIPLTPQTEALCYEFKATLGEDEYIVYINVKTGAEEQIFKIINTENGQLVI